MAYERRKVTDGITVMNKDLYDNLQDGIDELNVEVESVKEDVNKRTEEVNESIEVLNDAIVEVNQKADTATSIANGRNRAHVFPTTEDMQRWLKRYNNKGIYKKGDNLYIVDVEVPDWWVAEVLDEPDPETGYYYKIAQLETQKVDLTEIISAIELNAKNISDINKALPFNIVIDDNAKTINFIDR